MKYMKLSSYNFSNTLKLIIFLGFLSIPLHSFTQNGNITLPKRITIENAFDAIEKQTGMTIAYNEALLDVSKTVEINVTNKTLEQALTEILKNTPVTYTIHNKQILIVEKTRQQGDPQKVTIRGTVVDTMNEPIIGATVSLKGLPTGTITDIDGSFTLNAPVGSTLLVSFLGYKAEEIAIGNKTTFNIKLRDDNQTLDEVVVVGYGSVRKANLTGAVDQINSKILEDRPVTSVAQALQGAIGNVNIMSSTDNTIDGGGSPGAKMSFNIRGVTGLDGTNKFKSAEPLFVIDGIQGGDINSINPDDIESVSVLKDAASAAIYGSSAPYGVVLITTKQGKKTAKPTISYSTNMGWSNPINLPTMMNSVEWAELMNEAKQNASGVDFISEENMQRIKDYYEGKITTSTVANPGRKGVTSYASFDNFGNGLSNDNINWYDVFFKSGAFAQQHNLSVQGGSETTNYYVGIGYNSKEGILRYGTDSFDRYSVRGNISSIINKYVTANIRSSFTKGINDAPANTSDDNFMQLIAQRWPIIPLHGFDGTFTDISRVDYYQKGGRKTTTNNLLTMTGELVITPLKGWDATVNYTYSSNNIVVEKNKTHFTTNDAFGVPYYVPSWNSDGFDEYSRGLDQLTRERIDEERQTFNAFTSYEFNTNGHYFKGMVGFAQEKLHYYKMTANSGNVTLYNTDLPTFETLYYNTNGQSIGEPEKKTLTTRGVFGRINYSFEDRYLFEFNGRYDGSSRYMKDKRFKFYPGVSGAWIISQEKFWNNSMSSVLDFLKFRVSYGALGETGGDNYYPFYPNLKTTAATSSNWLFNGTRYSSLSFPSLVDPNITWVTSATIDFGLDFVTLNNRLSVNFDWYQRNSKDVIGPAEALPSVLGVPAANTNNAALRTRGFEITLGWRDRINSIGLDYGVKATLADSKTVVTKYPNPNKLISRWYEGATIGDIWGYVTDRYYMVGETIDQNEQGNDKGPGKNWKPGDIKYKDLDGDNIITRGDETVDNPGDKKIIGNSRPRYTFGLTLDAAWKGFDISLFFHGVGKRDAWMGTDGPGNFWGTPNSEWQANFLTIHHDRWTPENPNGYFPKYYLGGGENAKNMQQQTKYLQNAAFVRFKNFQVGYTFPKTLLNKVGFERLRVYVSGENLATFTNFVETMDPEFAGANRGLTYPLQRTWSLGLNLSF